jgi:uncharacterized protein YyaL (SSP411 family)
LINESSPYLPRHYHYTADEQALAMVEKSLTQMRVGGIYDHIGFGFHRYSTDAQWLVPHFEKMLYDQALLSVAYTEAYQANGKHFYAQTVREIFVYILRDMTSPEGGFYSAEDADSEGVEGKFYLWTTAEIQNIIGKEEYEAVKKIYSLENDGNFKPQEADQPRGSNILHLGNSPVHLAAEQGIPEKNLLQRLEKAESITKVFSGLVEKYPPGHAYLLMALGYALNPSYEVVVAGKIGDSDTGAMLKTLHRPFIPGKIVVFLPADKTAAAEIIHLAPYTEFMTPHDGKATAYVCTNFVCELPTTDVSQMLAYLQVKRK